MSACEECWAEASFLARVHGRMTADVYPEVLRANEAKHVNPAPVADPDTTNQDTGDTR